MRKAKEKFGFTLVEMLTVVAVIAILVSIVLSIAIHTDTQAKKQLTESTVATLTAVLRQFSEHGYEYKGLYAAGAAAGGFKFPLDCNDLGLTRTLEEALGVPAGSVVISGAHDVHYSGCEAMYFFLNRVAECRETIEKIDRSLLTQKGVDGGDLIIKIVGKSNPLVRITDAWDTPLRYEYYNYNPGTGEYIKRTFPLITSAGADRRFETAGDNVTNR